MTLTGDMHIGARRVTGQQGRFRAVNPATGIVLEPAYALGGIDDVASACTLAEQAFDIYRATSARQRAAFLDTIASHIEALGDGLIARAMAETGLPRARLEASGGAPATNCVCLPRAC